MPLSNNTGPIATAAWLAELGLTSRARSWHVEILIGSSECPPHDDAPTLLRVDIYSEEWGYLFRHAGKMSWIRVTDVAFVHGRDDHALLSRTPPLREIGSFARQLEAGAGTRLDRSNALIRTSLDAAEKSVRAWLAVW